MAKILENTPENFEKLINETNEYKDKYLRTYAEMDNLKKRVERDKNKSIKFANEKFALDLLETIDNIEKVLGIDMPEDIKDGIDLIYRGLKKMLTKYKIIECETILFDPNIHHAISFIESNDGEKIISEVLRKGYFMDGKLLRPATVVVKG